MDLKFFDLLERKECRLVSVQMKHGHVPVSHFLSPSFFSSLSHSLFLLNHLFLCTLSLSIPFSLFNSFLCFYSSLSLFYLSSPLSHSIYSSICFHFTLFLFLYHSLSSLLVPSPFLFCWLSLIRFLFDYVCLSVSLSLSFCLSLVHCFLCLLYFSSIH